MNPFENIKRGENDKPILLLEGQEVSFDIDNTDGAICAAEPSFSDCALLTFSKAMNPDVSGTVLLDGQPVSYVLKFLNYGNELWILGIKAVDMASIYGKTYQLHIEGFTDTDGNVMEPADIPLRTLPAKNPDPAYAAHDEISLQVAREGIVLLKNKRNVLPLDPKSALAVYGGAAFRLGTVGAGHINPRYYVGFLRAIDEYSDFSANDNTAETGIIVINRRSGEGFDNNAENGAFYLTDEEERTIAKMKELFKKTVAVINSGYPMDLRWVEKFEIDAVLWCGFPGMLGGRALVEILDGRVNPSGKLPDTWSLDYFDIPSSANFYLPPEGSAPLTAESPVYINTVYEEDLYVGYRYFETFNKPVAYPFGFGLSYTDFSITGMIDGLQVGITVKNTGAFPGKEVVQIYVKIPEDRLEQPLKRLAGFTKTKLLSPGETEELTILINKNDLSSFDTENARWIMEKGRYEFFIGDSIKNLSSCGEIVLAEEEIIRQSENLMKSPVEIDILSKNNPAFPKGSHSGIQEGATELMPKARRKRYGDSKGEINDLASKMTVEELARLSVCASHGWGPQGKGEAGRIFKLDNYDIPGFTVADGNHGVNIYKPNIGMPCSNTLCATWNAALAYDAGRAIAEEAKENDIQMILAPALNIHRNPLNGRHPEYFSEDPYLAGIMAGHQSKGLEENNVASCVKHATANNCETARKRNHSIISERALREIYLKAFEVAIGVHKPASLMTAYNALNGVYTACDEEMIQGVFRREFGFEGFIMTDWTSYDTANIVEAVQAGNCWMTPGSADDTYVTPIIKGVEEGKINLERLRNNVRFLLRVARGPENNGGKK
jgi:beta-glucosidase